MVKFRWVWKIRHQYRRLSRCFTTSCGGRLTVCHQPFVSFPLIEISTRQNLTTTIVFDKVVVKGEPAAVTESLNSITRCAVTLIPSNSNDTAYTATGSAWSFISETIQDSHFANGCRIIIARTWRMVNLLATASSMSSSVALFCYNSDLTVWIKASMLGWFVSILSCRVRSLVSVKCLNQILSTPRLREKGDAFVSTPHLSGKSAQ